jgi:hypothetical protein
MSRLLLQRATPPTPEQRSRGRRLRQEMMRITRLWLNVQLARLCGRILQPPLPVNGPLATGDLLDTSRGPQTSDVNRYYSPNTV